MPFARVNGNMLFYREVGDGPLALFVHGFPLDHSLWLDQLKGLAHVRRCVAVDLRGFGKSDPIVDPTLTMEMLADDLAGVIEALGAAQADIVSHSMGGYVALALWELRPTLVRSLTLIDTRASTRYETFVAALEGMKERQDRTSLLSRIEVPVLVAGGEDDALIPMADLRALAEPIPGARTTIIPNAGHLPPIEQPDRVNHALIELFEGRKVVWWNSPSR
jgi:pimeloyl-ACP methyl ester carboxylesterase